MAYGWLFFGRSHWRRVLENFKTLIEMPNKIGLQINLTEFKLFSVSGKVDNDVLNKFNEVSLGISGYKRRFWVVSSSYS